MLIGYDLCIANGTIRYFQREKLIVKHDDESTKRAIMNSREEERIGGLL